MFTASRSDTFLASPRETTSFTVKDDVETQMEMSLKALHGSNDESQLIPLTALADMFVRSEENPMGKKKSDHSKSSKGGVMKSNSRSKISNANSKKKDDGSDSFDSDNERRGSTASRGSRRGSLQSSSSNIGGGIRVAAKPVVASPTGGDSPRAISPRRGSAAPGDTKGSGGTSRARVILHGSVSDLARNRKVSAQRASEQSLDFFEDE